MVMISFLSYLVHQLGISDGCVCPVDSVTRAIGDEDINEVFRYYAECNKETQNVDENPAFILAEDLKAAATDLAVAIEMLNLMLPINSTCAEDLAIVIPISLRLLANTVIVTEIVGGCEYFGDIWSSMIIEGACDVFFNGAYFMWISLFVVTACFLLLYPSAQLFAFNSQYFDHDYI
jgi:hypothetical protein